MRSYAHGLHLAETLAHRRPPIPNSRQANSGAAGVDPLRDPMSPSDPSAAMARLLALMAKLRDPGSGCPWDREQTFASIAPYTIEEAYEVAEAIRQDDMEALKDELGDLLLQVVFHAQMAAEAEVFDFAQVAQGISDKMERRHPHVFANAKIADSRAQTAAWEAGKAALRAQSGAGALDDVALALPALTRALKLQARAARVGFDWPDIGPVLDKIREEIDELERALANPADAATGDPIAEELGDLMFVLVNFCRHRAIDPEGALRAANAKFERRFRAIEARLLARGLRPEHSSLEEMDALWNEVKKDE